MADLLDIIEGDWTGTYVDQTGTSYQVTITLALDGQQRVEARIAYPSGQTTVIDGGIDSVTNQAIEYSWRILLRRGRGRWSRVDDTHVTGSWGAQQSFDDRGRFDLEKDLVRTLVLKDAFGDPIAFTTDVTYTLFDAAGAALKSDTLAPGADLVVDVVGLPHRVSVQSPGGYMSFDVDPIATP